jgi:hypothetical protein
MKLNWNTAYRTSDIFYYYLYSEKHGWLVSNLPSTTVDTAIKRVMSWLGKIKLSSLNLVTAS